MNAGITISALIVAAVQVLFFINMIWSLKHGKKADGNPWKATTLEWLTPDTPPGHGNWGPKLPEVYRWAYDYSVPGAVDDFIPQTVPPDAEHGTADVHDHTAPHPGASHT
jgi:cytochrome c oxidase subunit 1